VIRSILFFTFLGISCAAAGSSFSYSAKRDEGQSWQQRAKIQRGFHRQRISYSNAQDMGQSFSKVDLSTVTVWNDYQEIEEYFRRVRDDRFLEDPSVIHFLRRPTWMYPDDGCFARAHMMETRLEFSGKELVKKIFVFGDLRVATGNASDGYVRWWYHVAPIVSDGKEYYVLDPAIEPEHPLPLVEWLSRMGRAKDFTLSICESGTYTPYEDCLNPGDEAAIALDDQKYFMDLERYRINDLGRDAVKELGDAPPWIHPAGMTRP
jgi:hypothetical protein